MHFIAFEKDAFEELSYYIEHNERPGGEMVTDTWVESNLTKCVAEVKALREVCDYDAIASRSTALIAYWAKKLHHLDPVTQPEQYAEARDNLGAAIESGGGLLDTLLPQDEWVDRLKIVGA